MGKTWWRGGIGIVAWVTVTALAPPAGAAAPPTVDQLRGSARAQALDLHLLGRRMGFGLASAEGAADRVAGALRLSASGTGTLLSHRTAATAGTGGAAGPGGRACFQPPLGELLAGAKLPQLVVGEAACGEASAAGDPERFEAVGTGTSADLRLRAAQVLGPVLRPLAPTLDPVGKTPVGELLQATDNRSKQAVAALDGLFGQLLGSEMPVLPAVEPAQTVDDLLARLGDGDLLRLRLGDAVTRTTAVPDRLSATATAQGGVIEVLPAFRGPGTAPLLTIVTGTSRATVGYDREAATPTGTAGNVLVRVDSDLLAPQRPEPRSPARPARPAAGPAPAPAPAPASVELAPGQSIDLLCDTPAAALCSTVSVGEARETPLPGGGLRVESAAVSVHLFKNLDRLVPGSTFATALADDRVPASLRTAASREGLSLGEPSPVAGVRLDLALAVAETGGARLVGASREEQGRELTPVTAGELPRTGGSPARAAGYALGLSGAGAILLASTRSSSRRHRRKCVRTQQATPRRPCPAWTGRRRRHESLT